MAVVTCSGDYTDPGGQIHMAPLGEFETHGEFGIFTRLTVAGEEAQEVKGSTPYFAWPTAKLTEVNP